MVIKGYKQPLVQEDMWNLNEEDSTAYINEHFQQIMQSKLAMARVRYHEELKKNLAKRKEKAQDEAYANESASRMGKGISQDVLMMVKNIIIAYSKTIHYNTYFVCLCKKNKRGVLKCCFVFLLGGKRKQR